MGLTNEDEIRIVLNRLEHMPANLRVSIGGEGSLDKAELIEHVKKCDETGELIVKAHMEYLRSFKKYDRFGGE